jgi:adenylosuccinate synthase
MIGTTKKGIGPAYTDKASREGIRIIDMYDDELFYNLIKENVERKNLLFREGGKPEMDADAIYEEYKGYREEIKRFVTDTSVLIYKEYYYV